MTREEAVKRANGVRESIEKHVDDLASEPFSPEAKVALTELLQTLANC